MSAANTSLSSKKSLKSKSFSNMTKEQIKQKLKEKANSSGFDWGLD